jgi:hypothetical protein
MDMAEKTTGEMRSTRGFTGLTMNAMALIAPGAVLWPTFYIQAAKGVTAPSMWLGIVVVLLLCLATAACYAELAKLYAGPGSSYYLDDRLEWNARYRRRNPQLDRSGPIDRAPLSSIISGAGLFSSSRKGAPTNEAY